MNLADVPNRRLEKSSATLLRSGDWIGDRSIPAKHPSLRCGKGNGMRFLRSWV